MQVDDFAHRLAIRRNAELEFQRNRERYAFLRWGQGAFDNFKVVPPNTGIVHQVNLEYLARVVESRDGTAFPDTLVGTDSHTTMVNGLGVLGWGVGGIEAEAAMLGEAISMLVPQVVGFKLTGRLPEGATATDLVLTVTQILRATGVVGKFVEYFGHGLAGLPLADRATIGNMSPEYGATCGFFPVDDETLKYLRLTGRPDERIALVEAYCKENALWHDPADEPTYSQVVELDLSTVEPSLAGPRRPQDRVPLAAAKQSFLDALETFGVEYGNEHDQAVADTFPASDPPADTAPGHDQHVSKEVHVEPVALVDAPEPVSVELDGEEHEITHGVVVIAAITSCTNTSNPAVMVGAGLLAKKAVERGLTRRPWVKSSLAPGSKVVTDYYDRAGLTPYLEELGFHTVGYGCTTCIGNSGPLPGSRLRGGRRGRPGRLRRALGQPQLRGADPPGGEGELPRLAAARGRVRARGADGRRPRRRSRSAPARTARTSTCATSGRARRRCRRRSPARSARTCSASAYADVFTGDPEWRELPVPDGDSSRGTTRSTYIRQPPYFEGMAREPGRVEDVEGARCLVIVGDSVTTDHISPAGSIKPDSPAGRYLVEHGVERKDFNSYGSRRGNHEVMVRGTFANVRLRNLLVPGSEGTWTVHVPSGEEMTIFDASQRYLAEGDAAGRDRREGVRLGLVARLGREGPEPARRAGGDRRDLRAHPPLEPADDGDPPAAVPAGECRESLGLTGRESFSIPAWRTARRARSPSARTTSSSAPRAARHPARARVPPPRRHPPVRPPPAARGVSPPLLVVVTGEAATGKTTLARALAAELGLPLLAKDDLKERALRHARHGRPRVVAATRRRHLRAALRLADGLLGAGTSCVVEANWDARPCRGCGAARPQPVPLVVHRARGGRSGAVRRAGRQRRAPSRPPRRGHRRGARRRRTRGRWGPLDLDGELLVVDTAEPVDVPWLAAAALAAA